jgi:molecular chaperone DnaJ
MRDPYEVLGVGRDATPEEIKAAYRRLARQHHPDVNSEDPNAEETFKEIGQAYAVLSDPDRRARYDQFGTVDESTGDFAHAGNFTDLFDMFFGGGFSTAGGAQIPNGEDVRADVEIELADVVTGVEKEVRYRRYVRCTSCSGSGGEGGAPPTRCSRCSGSGHVSQIRETFLGTIRTSATCPQCRGAGAFVEKPCPDCRGQGLVVGEATGSVRIPAGIRHGATLRLPGSGSEAADNGRPGDLYVVVSVRPDPRFERHGQDLHGRLELTFAQAALGDEIVVEAVDAEHDLAIPPGTQPGTVLRIRGAGLPPLHGGRRGDLNLHATVRVPDKVTEAQADLIRELAELSGERIPKSGAEGGLLGGLFKKKK